MLMPDTGELGAFYARELVSGGPTQDIELRRSSDGGRTWSAAQVVSHRTNSRDGMPGVVRLDGLTLMLIFEGTDLGRMAVRTLVSPDGGRTWQVADTPLASGQSSGIFSIAFRDAKHGVVAGGDYRKEAEAVDNLAITNDGGTTWTLIKGLSGFRSVVTYVPGRKTLIAIGPSGGDYSLDDGRTWTSINGPGFDTFSFAPGKQTGWGAGAKGAIGKLTFTD